MVSCTYPAPFHAHTHFLATISGILILDTASQAPTSLCAITLLQNLHHLRLVDWVNTLQVERDKEALCFSLLCSFPIAPSLYLVPSPLLAIATPQPKLSRTIRSAILHLAVPVWVPSSVSTSPSHKPPRGSVRSTKQLKTCKVSIADNQKKHKAAGNESRHGHWMKV